MGGASLFYLSYKTSLVPFISTTGFYFSGIDADDPDLIQSWAEYGDNNQRQKIYTFQQYRTTDDYIYNHWRRELRFHFKADKVYFEMPDSIWKKVQNVWLKSGDNVWKFDRLQLENDGIVKINENSVKFTSTSAQYVNNSVVDGFRCFYNTGSFFGLKNKYVVYLYFVFVLGGCIYFFWKKIGKSLGFLISEFKKQFKKHKEFWSVLLSISAGILTVFIFLELSLRIVGYFHERRNIDKNYTLAENSDKVIICLGDSYTDGIGSTPGNDYPAVLDRIIKSECSSDYTVINFGQSGKNTTQIKDEFLVYLKKNKPELVVLMAGSANYWNYYGFEDNYKFIYTIRTFKLIKLLWNELFNKNDITSATNDKPKYTEANYIHNREQFENSLFTNIGLRDSVSMVSFSDRDLIYYSVLSKSTQDFSPSFRDSLDHDLKQLLLIHDFYKNVRVNINDIDAGYYRGLYIYALSENFGPFMRNVFLQLSIKEYPYLEDAYYNLLKNNGNPPQVPEDFENNRVCLIDTVLYYNCKFGFASPEKKVSNVFIEESFDLDIKTDKISKWVNDDLEDVILACRENGIQIILMTYPFKYENPVYEPVNDVLIDLSKKYEITLVDNFTVFSNLPDDRNAYFVSDGHCSDKGYKLIAEGVFSVIKKNKMLRQQNK